MELLAEMNEKILSFLLERQEKDPRLFFTLRKTNRYGRLENGYWFTGSNSVVISFWDGQDWKTKTPNIFLEIWQDARISLSFTARDSEKKASFFKNVIEIVPGFIQHKTKKGEKYDFWYKNYVNKHDYIQNLNFFLENDKKKIDGLLKLYLENNKDFDIQFLTQIQQTKYLKSIESYRKEAKKYPNTLKEKKRIDELNLEKIELTNIGHFKKLEIDLSKRVTCLLGKNGTGKSTILRAIALGLAGTDHNKEGFSLKKIESLLKIETAVGAKQITAKEGSIKVKYEIDKKYENEIVFKENEYAEIEITDLIVEKNKFESVTDRSIFHVPIIGFPQALEEKEKSLELKLIKKDKPNLSDVVHLILNIPDNRFSVVKNWLFDIKNEKIELLELFYKTITTITGEEIKINTGKKGEKKKVSITTSVSKNGIPLELISQGLDNVIVWVGFLFKRLSELSTNKNDFRLTKGIVLIDEIDTHLHIKWQKTILRTLQDIFINIQFVVTTHSPFVIQSVKESNVYLLELENDNVTAKLLDIEEGSSYEYIISDKFKEISIFNNEIEKKLNDFYSLRDNLYENKKINMNNFRKIIIELTSEEKSEELKALIGTEKAQIEFVTGQKIDL